MASFILLQLASSYRLFLVWIHFHKMAAEAMQAIVVQ